MHLWTKILSPRCRCMCRPAGPSICPTREGIKCSQSQSHTQMRFSSPGTGVRPTGQASYLEVGERGSLPISVVNWGDCLIVPHPTAVPLKEQDIPDSVKTRSIWRPLEHATLWEVPSTMPLTARPQCMPKWFWGQSIPSLSSGKPAPPKCHWSPGSSSSKISGLCNHWLSLGTQHLTCFPSFNHQSPRRGGENYHPHFPDEETEASTPSHPFRATLLVTRLLTWHFIFWVL